MRAMSGTSSLTPALSMNIEIPAREHPPHLAAPARATGAAAPLPDARARDPRHPRVLLRAGLPRGGNAAAGARAEHGAVPGGIRDRVRGGPRRAPASFSDQLARICDEAAAGGRAAAHLPDLQSLPQP